MAKRGAVSALLGAGLMLAGSRGRADEPGREAPITFVGWTQDAAQQLPAWPTYSAHWDYAYAYYTPTDQVVVFGGAPARGTTLDGDPLDGSGWSNETWLFGNGTWTPGPAAPAALRPRGGGAMAYLPTTSRIVLFGGGTVFADNPGYAEWPPVADTWVWSPGAGWEASPATGPAGRVGAEMAYDPVLGQLIMFGGSGLDRHVDTWLFDGTTWTLASAGGSGQPGPRQYFPMTWHPVLNRVVMGGGNGEKDTWSFNRTTMSWEPFTPLPREAERLRWVYDPQLGGLVFFSGMGPGAAVADLWLLPDGTSTWLRIFINADGPWPPQRIDGSLLFHPVQDGLMVFGGVKNSGFGKEGHHDVWFFRAAPPVVVNPVLNPPSPTIFQKINLDWSSYIGYRPLTYVIEWYRSQGGGPFTLIPGETLPRLLAGTAVAGDQVHARIMVKDSAGQTGPWQQTQTVTVVPPPVAPPPAER